MKGPVIEKLSKKNFDNLIYLIERLAEYEKLQPPNEQAKRRLKNDGLSKKSRFKAYLWRFNGEYIGYVIFYIAYSSFRAVPALFLEDIFVLNEYRKKGIGHKMFNFCIKKAKELGCGSIDLHVIDWNKPAIKFFEENKAKRLNWVLYRLEIED